MSDDTPRPADETQPVRPGDPAPAADLPPAPATAAPTSTPAPAQVERRGFRERFATLRRSDGDRTFGLAALIASALAGIIVGGLGVATFQAVTDDHDRGGFMQRRDLDGDEGFGGRGGMHGGPRGVPGQLPPTTLPDDEDSSNG
jgi:hypothetical protein